MRIRTDEAGDFNYEDPGRFWVSVVAGVIVPDEEWEPVTAWVRDRCSDWSVDELKASALNDAQMLTVARFIVDRQLTVAAIATDSRIFTATDQAEWRARQVTEFQRAVARSKRAVNDPEIRERVQRLERRMHSARHIRSANYLQYGILMPWLIAQLISASLLAYRELPAERDSWLIDIAMDAKPGADPGKAGELLRDSVEHIFAGDDRTVLLMPGEWPDDHPFKVRNTDREKPVISVRQVLAPGIAALESHDDAGLQLADLVAHVVLTLIREPDDAGAVAAWSALAPRVSRTQEGMPIKVWAWPGEGLTGRQIAPYERLADSYFARWPNRRPH